VAGVTVSDLALDASARASAAVLVLLNRGAKVNCVAHVAIVHLEALGEDTAGRVIFGVKAGANAELVAGICRDDTDDRGHDQGDGGNGETHGEKLGTVCWCCDCWFFLAAEGWCLGEDS